MDPQEVESVKIAIELTIHVENHDDSMCVGGSPRSSGARTVDYEEAFPCL
ncbi:MAG: hypothetical protein BWY17_01016 [Deltaproteobacteria bacterium ADurb.Bin207]|nr:MAG: hypothetical protein BWY17_01016 [Deltaproteobacteria bacterium ADurb.Bin207]